MPNYTVHYFLIKPTHVPAQRASSGSAATVSQTSAAANQARARVLAAFETRLADLMRRSAAHIPGPAQTWTASVNRIPEASPGVPNFAAVTVQPHEPIVYLVTRHNDESTATPTAAINRRASLVLCAAVDNNYPEVPGSLMSQARQLVMNDPQTIAGKALHFSQHVPAVAEVFSNLRMQYEATNWEEIQWNFLAILAFHEIAHCKLECTNRGSGSRWRAAVSGSIHDQSGVGLCAGALDWSDDPTTADLQLMGRHMLCPIRFYKLDQPIAGQFFTAGQAVTLTPRGSGSAPSSTGSGSGESRDDLDLDGLDI